MSDPPTTPMPPQPITPRPHSLIHHGGATAPSSSSSLAREYRKGNWTIEETLILITAKKLDDERRMKTSSTPQDPTRPAPAAFGRSSGELRWKWVENYCWNHGCLRSQNQCNDKWDNLLREYKKVRDYESKLLSSSQSNSNNTQNLPSYWTITKQQRKEHNLPSNMLPEIYQAIRQVYTTKQTQTTFLTTDPQPLVTTSSSPLPILDPPPHPPVTLALPPPPPPQPPANSTTPAVSGNVVINQCAATQPAHDSLYTFFKFFYC